MFIDQSIMMAGGRCTCLGKGLDPPPALPCPALPEGLSPRLNYCSASDLGPDTSLAPIDLASLD